MREASWGWSEEQGGRAAERGAGDRLSAPQQSGAPRNPGYTAVTSNPSFCNNNWPPVLPGRGVQGAFFQSGLQVWALWEGEAEFAADFSRHTTDRSRAGGRK